MAGEILGQIVDDPSADDRIIGNDQDGDDGVDPAAERQPLPLAKMAVSAHRAFAGHPAQRRFSNDHGVAKGDSQQDVDEQKNAAAVFCGQIREAPDVSQPDRRTGGGQHESEFAGKRTALVLSFHVFFPLFQLIKSSVT